ncbi:MAG: late control D family protein [Halanaerobium sp. T82-1]|jgi:hypothetical protein|nr:MAG: late control D family protein [Halanaerobium sp. T82-1]
MKTRRANPIIYYQGTNITKNLEKEIKSFSFTDVASGSSDTIQLKVHDITKKWLSNWAPQTGDVIEASIKVEDWNKEGDTRVFSCGKFIVDRPRYRGRPVELSLNAAALPNDTDFTTTKKSRTWNKATLEKIAQKIANENNLNLVFDSSLNPDIKFVEQSEVSDKTFLNDLCTRYGVVMKIYKEKIVLYNEKDYESKEPVTTIDESELEDWDLDPNLTDSGYDGAHLSYFDPETEEHKDYTFIIPGEPGKKILEINDLVFSLSEAEAKAKGALRKKNKSEINLKGKLSGGTFLVAGSTIEITGLGIYSGKYYIDKIIHNVKPYKMGLEMHKVLEGY